MTSEHIFDFRLTGSAGPGLLGGKALCLSKMTQMGVGRRAQISH